MKTIVLVFFGLLLFSCRGQSSPSATADPPNMNTSADSLGGVHAEVPLPELPYRQLTDPNTVTYLLLDKRIEGTKAHLGGDLRYLPLPNKNDIRVILVPTDWGDFPYSYDLLTIKHNRVIGKLYVEGEGKWWEIGGDSGVTKTHFSIDENYRITVVSTYEGEETVTHYTIDDAGRIYLDASLPELPYHQLTDPKTVAYQLMYELVEGTEGYLYGDLALRYLPLPNKNDIRIILMPMDQGDFLYSYYLLTIKHNRVVDEIYVEGEWWEPDGDSGVTKTHFSIDENYRITVVSTYEGEETVAHYTIDDAGQIHEL